MIRFRYLILLSILYQDSGDTYIVKIETENHINLVDSKFLSFTLDPRFLFSASEKYKSKECICMASSLKPAYIRIAGPSTPHMTFKNTTIAITHPTSERITLIDLDEELAVTHRQWERFVQWAKGNGFELVFALNNAEKMRSGMWDPNTALNILTVADQAHIGDIFWQLGYECKNQSIEEYLHDLETLRVILETYPAGRAGRWRVVGGDVTHCLHADSKSDFKDYVTLSTDMMDAVLLNGNSTTQELERMSERDRQKLLKLLSHSDTPLWITEPTQHYRELERAAGWITSLGFSARNGFSVHFRELLEEELYEPTLSFYMSLLYKNLVGERVLNVDVDGTKANLFAHCTSLRHKPVPGAVTLFGVNMDDEPARFSIKLSKKEDGGDIMQFILGLDHNENIVVNGRAMYYEGDMKPVVKRVRPYKTLLLSLPPKSFGFWVLANTQVEACQDIKNETTFDEANIINDEEKLNTRAKRSILKKKYKTEDNEESFNDYETDVHNISQYNKALQSRLDNLNKDLLKVREIFQQNTRNVIHRKRNINKTKRQTSENENNGNWRRKYRRQGIKAKNSDKNSNTELVFGSTIIRKLLQALKSDTLVPQPERTRKIEKLVRNRFGKRNYRHYKTKSSDHSDENIPKPIKKTVEQSSLKITPLDDSKEESDKVSRVRRSINYDSSKDKYRKRNKTELLDEIYDELSSENEINVEKDKMKLGKILHKLKHIMPDSQEDNENSSKMDEVLIKTKLTDDGAAVDFSEKPNHGFIRSTIEDLLSLLVDLNRNLNRLLHGFAFLDD